MISHIDWESHTLDQKGNKLSTSAHNIPAGLSLRANFSWTFAGNVVYAACQWATLAVLTKLGSPAMVGQFALGLAIATPVIMFANLQLRNIQATDARNEYLFGDYLSLRLVTTALALLVIAGIVLVTGYPWETALVILAVGVSKAIEAISGVFYGLLQQHERMDRIATSMMIRGALSLIGMTVGVYLTGSVFWGVTGLTIARTLVLVGYDVSTSGWMSNATLPTIGSAGERGDRKAALRPRWETGTLARLAWLALPLGVVMSLISLRASVPRYFIARSLGEYALGIFAAIAYLPQAGTVVVGALGQSATPRLAKHYAAGNGKAFRELLIKLVGIGALLGTAGVLVALVAGRELLTLLYRPEYAQRDLFVWVMVGAGISYVAGLLGHSMMATRHFRVQVPMFIVVTGLTALTCLWLVPTYGLHGAAIALIVGNSVQAGGVLAVIVHALRALRGHTRENERTGCHEAAGSVASGIEGDR